MWAWWHLTFIILSSEAWQNKECNITYVHVCGCSLNSFYFHDVFKKRWINIKLNFVSFLSLFHLIQLIIIQDTLQTEHYDFLALWIFDEVTDLYSSKIKWWMMSQFTLWIRKKSSKPLMESATWLAFLPHPIYK